MPEAVGCILPDWPAPDWVGAVSTERVGGVSAGPYGTLNLGEHVGDDPSVVAQNRRLLLASCGLAEPPLWLNQVHGTVTADGDGDFSSPVKADASVASRPGRACAVMTADCLPVLFADRTMPLVGAAHAGWRGLVAGVLETCIASMERKGAQRNHLIAWLGPAIGPAAFEVGDDVRAAFLAESVRAERGFQSSGDGKWLADLYFLARLRLQAAAISAVFGGGMCTWSSPERFFSYRRDGVTGRQASLIWIKS